MGDLKAGQRVVFTVRSGNDRIDPSVHEVESCEIHNGLAFYRLKGQTGLYLRSSLATTTSRERP